MANELANLLFKVVLGAGAVAVSPGRARGSMTASLLPWLVAAPFGFPTAVLANGPQLTTVQGGNNQPGGNPGAGNQAAANPPNQPGGNPGAGNQAAANPPNQPGGNPGAGNQAA